MKRLLRVFGVLVLILTAAVVLLPIIFKDEIIARAKMEINKNLNAHVEFGDMDLALFRSFPNFTLGINDISIDGKDDFEGVRLAEIDRFQIDLDLMSVLSGNDFKVEKLLISDARLQIHYTEEGKANYDILKSTSPDTANAPKPEGASNFSLELKAYVIKDLDLVYDDPGASTLVHIHGLNHRGSGDWSQNMVNLSTRTTARSVTVGYEQINYLNRVKMEMDAELSYDQSGLALSFGDNLLQINDLPLEFVGALSFPEDKVVMDINFTSPSTDLKQILSLIPAIYVEDYDDMESRGSFAFSGSVKGTYDYEDVYPSYDIKLMLKDGYFKYPELPKAVEDIEVDARIFTRGTDPGDVNIEIPGLQAKLAGNPIAGRMSLADQSRQKAFDFMISTDLDLSSVSQVVPLEGYTLKGRLNSNISMAGDLQMVERKDYDQLKAQGILKIDSLLVDGDSLDQSLKIDVADIALSPRTLEINRLVTLIGASDFRLRGNLDNLFGYLMNDEMLKGSLFLDSDMINLNELSSSESGRSSQKPGESDSASSLEIIRIPEDLDISLASSIRQLVYDDLMINDIVGRMNLSKGVARVNQLDMRLLGGRMRMSGSYDSKPESPLVNINFDLRNFDIRESYQKIGTMQQLAPVMKNSSGLYSTVLNFRGQLKEGMAPDLATLTADGNLSTRNLQTSPKALQKLSDVLNNPGLAILALNDLSIIYAVRNGRIETKPFTIRSKNMTSEVYGSMGLDQSLDYTMNMSIPLKDLGASKLLSQLGSDPDEKVQLKVDIGGTAKNPSIKTSVKDLAGSMANQVVEEVKEKVEKLVEDAKDDINQKSDELIREAEAKGDQLISEAQKQADRIVNEAENQAANIRNESNKQARKLEDEAKGNFIAEKAAKVAADKLRDEGDAKAKSLVDAARKKANGLVEEARKQKAQLVNDAREKTRLQ